jgi:anti-sigma factor RsiW
MNEPANSQVCERASDLISFLYGELSEREARSFDQHKRTCERCESELAAFGQVRNSVQLWRDESLSLSIGTVPQTEVAPKRSAFAAIRSFFEISPLWMKGATAFAAMLLCILSALAGARLLDEPQPPVPFVSWKTDDEIRIEIESRANLLAQSRIDSATLYF